MRIADMNWMQVERYLERDDRCVLPIGSTEQHAQLSLCVDAILAERVAVEAAEPLGVPVYPAVPFGVAPYFQAFPGSVSLRVETLLAVVRDLLASMRRSGFRRVLMVNGHGGNAPVGALAQELMCEWPEMCVRLHNWWNAPATWAAVSAVDPVGSHGSWMENFPWTRLASAPAPEGVKPMVDMAALRAGSPERVRALVGDGNFGGAWAKSDEEMARVWAAGVAETREALEGPWPNQS
ncbi:MAG: creatininase family protein [Ectothiorhodospiraceae bacterium]|nr:creatininase family protein [Ectothiorhodospiraceae bacterium]